MIQGRTEVHTGLCQAGIRGGSLEEAVVLGASVEGWGEAGHADERERFARRRQNITFPYPPV